MPWSKLFFATQGPDSRLAMIMIVRERRNDAMLMRTLIYLNLTFRNQHKTKERMVWSWRAKAKIDCIGKKYCNKQQYCTTKEDIIMTTTATQMKEPKPIRSIGSLTLDAAEIIQPCSGCSCARAAAKKRAAKKEREKLDPSSTNDNDKKKKKGFFHKIFKKWVTSFLYDIDENMNVHWACGYVSSYYLAGIDLIASKSPIWTYDDESWVGYMVKLAACFITSVLHSKI